MVSCVFPGSFDPVTRGHLDLISRASRIFDRVTVTVMVNIHKAGAISPEQRVALLRKACSPYENVRVEKWDGLLADYMRKKEEKILIRGVRDAEECGKELQSAAASRLLNDQYEVFMIPSAPEYTGVSSTAVREIAAFGGEIGAFVPEGLTEEITALLSNKKH